jgi:hypothetical protein
VKRFFSDNFVMAQNGAWATGSYSRGTLTRWQRDVDLMAALSVSEYDSTYGNDSRKFLYFVRDALDEEYESTKVSSRLVSVKLDFSDFVVDVVPCFRRDGGGFLIPNGAGGWKATNPPFHYELMKDADAAHGNRLKPLARLMKAWNLANGHHLASFHVELMTERMWRDDKIGPYAGAVASTLKTMPSWLRNAFPDPWAAGGNIDADLSRDDRAVAIRMLEEDADNAEQAIAYVDQGQTEKAFKRWDVVYHGYFPGYG